MNNLEALKALCTAIASAFYADDAVLRLALFNNGIIAEEDAHPRDKQLLLTAIPLVRGFVETSRSEGGISVSVDRNAIAKSILMWCEDYGLDLEEYADGLESTIEDASDMW